MKYMTSIKVMIKILNVHVYIQTPLYENLILYRKYIPKTQHKPP